MIDFQKHLERLQKELSEEYAPGRNSIDRIDEETWWNKIIKVLNDISSKSAELMEEMGIWYVKPSYRTLLPDVKGLYRNDFDADGRP